MQEDTRELFNSALGNYISDSNQAGDKVVFEFASGGAAILTFKSEEAADSFLTGFNAIVMSEGDEAFKYEIEYVDD